MRDPLDELRRLAYDVPASPLPAEEVRRRGDRVRRRRAALHLAGAAAAVALVVSGAALASGSLTTVGPDHGPATTQTPSAEPRPSPTEETPPGGWLTDIPADFTVEDGMPEPGGDNEDRTVSDRLRTPWALDPCLDSAETGSRTDFVDVTQAAPAQFYRRQLAAYPDAAAAREVMARFAAELARCTADDTAWATYGPAFEAGDESFAVVAHAEENGLRFTPATHFAVVRVGNAVLVATYDGEFGAAPQDSIVEILQEPRAHAAAVADRMCVFASEPCGRSKG